jgi:hypothetical protein
MTWFSQATFLYAQAFRAANETVNNNLELQGELSKEKLASVLSRVGWWFYHEFDRHDKAHGLLPTGESGLSILETAYKLNSSDPIIMIKLAEVKRKIAKERTKEVLELLLAAKQLLPESPDVYRALYSGTGQFNGTELEKLAPNFAPELANFSRSYPAPMRSYTIHPDGRTLERKQYISNEIDVCAFYFINHNNK